MKEVTFAVITKNGEDILERCLKAINKIAYRNKELIVIIDGSNRKTIEISNKYSTKVIIKNEAEEGISTSRNIALSQSKGSLLFIIDGDIEIQFLDVFEVLDFFNSNNRLIAISGKYDSLLGNEWNFNNLLDARRASLYFKSRRTFIYSKLNYTTFSGGFCCINRDLLKEMPDFLPNINIASEDLIWQLELIKKGYLFGFMPNMVGVHYHIRSYRDGLNKIISESKGAVWLLYESFKLNGFPPILENILYIPSLLLIVPIVYYFSPIIALLICIFEFLPYYLTSIFYKELKIIDRLLFVIYSVLSKISFLGFLMIFFISHPSIKIIIKCVIFSLYSDIFAKIHWVKNNFLINIYGNRSSRHRYPKSSLKY